MYMLIIFVAYQLGMTALFCMSGKTAWFLVSFFFLTEPMVGSYYFFVYLVVFIFQADM